MNLITPTFKSFFNQMDLFLAAIHERMCAAVVVLPPDRGRIEVWPID
ncbi:hypothetical protein [Arthrobacter tumbae]|nr:hypothetical protein [Arthrobacter tumbae]MBM7782941.1 hypothetical protein [Arthrobacter tumbae]